MPADLPVADEPDRPDGPVRQPPQPPPAAVMGLLNYITATSMDEDYAHVSRREGSRGNGRPGAPGRVALIVLAAFGILVATAALQTSRSADATRTSHDELVKQVLARKAQLADRRELVDGLTGEVRTLETDSLAATVDGRAVQSRLDDVGVITGAEAARGPGVEIEVDDGPEEDAKSEVLDVDLQKMVNGLWLAGAEGISINGQRVTNLTAVRLAGASITVNFARISPPYTVLAIGDPDTLASRFVETPGGQWWLDLQALYGVKFEIDSSEENLTLPAADRLELRYAHIPDDPESLP